MFKREEKINTEFHGNRDFYYIVKGVAIERSKLNNISDERQIVPIINNFIERNFGGISYNIDINFKLEFDDIKDEMKTLKDEILKEKLNTDNKRRGEEVDNDLSDVINGLGIGMHNAWGITTLPPDYVADMLEKGLQIFK
jgi:hypothetical protein